MVPDDVHQANVGSSGQGGGSVVVQLSVVSVAPAGSHGQLSGLGNLEVVRIVEGGAVSVLLEGRLVTLQLVPVAGILWTDTGGISIE